MFSISCLMFIVTMDDCMHSASCMRSACIGGNIPGVSWFQRLTVTWQKGTSAWLVPDLGHLATGLLVRGTTRRSYSLFQTVFMPQTSEKLEGHIASGLFVQPSVPHEKIADTYFFSWQDYAPFLSYVPLKKYGCNLVSKISQKLLKLEPWNLMNRLVVMSRQPD